MFKKIHTNIKHKINMIINITINVNDDTKEKITNHSNKSITNINEEGN